MTLYRDALSSALSCEHGEVTVNEIGAASYRVVACDRAAIYRCDEEPESEQPSCTRVWMGPVESLASAMQALLPVDTLTPAAKAAKASRLFEAGRQLYKERRYIEACDMLAESDALSRSFGSVASLGECARREGQAARAWQLFDDAARVADSTGAADLAKFARRQAAELAPKLCTITINLADPTIAGMTVRVRDRVLPPAATIRTPVDPTAVEIVVEAPGMPSLRRTLRCAAGATVTVGFSANELHPPPPAPAAADPPRSAAPAADPGR